jgi:hypothetical protein
MVQTAANPGGLPKSVFAGLQAQLAANRSQFYRDLAAGPFNGYNRPAAKPSEAVVENWWRQGMMGGAKAQMTASSPSRRPTSPGSDENRGACVGYAWRRRPDHSLR